jgi:hypothetical protein
MARDVTFQIAPKLKSTMSHADPRRLKMFSDGISTLPSGKEIRTLFENATKRHKAGLPDVYAVTVRYRDQVGKREFEEVVDLDFWDLLEPSQPYRIWEP